MCVYLQTLLMSSLIVTEDPSYQAWCNSATRELTEAVVIDVEAESVRIYEIEEGPATLRSGRAA